MDKTKEIPITQRTKAEGGNLHPFDNTPEGKERAREAARKSQPACQAARKRKRTMREALDTLLARPLPPGSGELEMQIAEAFDIPLSEVTIQDALTLAAIRPAMFGDEKSLKFIRDTLGEAPVQEMVIDATIPEPLAPIRESD